MWIHAFSTTDGRSIRIAVAHIVWLEEADGGAQVRLSNGDSFQITANSYRDFLTQLDTRSQF